MIQKERFLSAERRKRTKLMVFTAKKARLSSAKRRALIFGEQANFRADHYS
jgi:hypothetical protein